MLSQRTEELEESMVRRNSELEESLILHLDDSLIHRAEAMQRNLTIRIVNFRRNVIQPQFDQINKSPASRDKGITPTFQNVHERFDRVDANISTLELDMKSEVYNMNNGLLGWMPRLMDSVPRWIVWRVDRLEAKVGQLELGWMWSRPDR
ncbi:uncharacterized protein BDW43DRAFT_305715 [Aspergillus alliaceus]|uniref:uncharacterized protein n=1 Tax=Petromyces alliaceus TaxID=209559 RepID=UPI0012A75740|nr:uncharacterized protein BDW43DRAFT_305715 [Aspergillus alliaceus]KAB8238813.1 hypothetical protein BDW43DRAFT_305715 [Aspergillus alliaceus]